MKNNLITIKESLFKNDSLKRSPFLYKHPISLNVTSNLIVTGPNKSFLCKVLAGQFITHPPLSRVFHTDKIQFLDFRNNNIDKTFISARYESYSYKGDLEMTDDVNSVFNYITGLSNYNTKNKPPPTDHVENLMNMFNLTHLKNKWINSLSNGQMRRAKIVQKLISNPDVLIIDDPFLGLDPKNTKSVSDSLQKVSNDITLILGLRPEDKLPEWIDDIVYIDEENCFKTTERKTSEIKEPQLEKIPNFNHGHVQFKNATVKYNQLVILQNFNWNIPKGTNWRILGDNGTGKTTLLSMLTGDHPQSWKSNIIVNNVLRKTGNGTSIFDINNSIGMTSPELHSLVPRQKTMRELIYNGLVLNVGNSNFVYKGKSEEISLIGQKYLDHFDQFISDTKFEDLSHSLQKLTLFLRAIVKNPEILILDEAFSCMDDALLKKCHTFIKEYLKGVTILSIGHINWELPEYQYVMKLLGDEQRNYEIFKVT